MKNLFLVLTVVILAVHVHILFGLPLTDNVDTSAAKSKRSEESLLPNANFAVVTSEKLLKLKELADAANDPKLHDLYRAVNHYVQMAKKNNEYVLWKYDAESRRSCSCTQTKFKWYTLLWLNKRKLNNLEFLSLSFFSSLLSKKNNSCNSVK